MPAPTLAELQARFFALVTQPEPVADAARAMATSDPGIYPLEGWLAKPAGLSIYASAYFARIRDVLREELPRVLGVLGEATFDRVVADYLVASPPVTASIHVVGRGFAAFLEGHAASRARPDAPDIARLDWARVAVIDAEDAEVLTPQALARVAPAAWGDVVFRVVPALELVETEFAVASAWVAAANGEAIPAPVASREAVLVWRRGCEVVHRALAAEEAAALRAIARGASFAEVCEGFAREGVSAEDAAQAAYACVAQWVVDGVLRDA